MKIRFSTDALVIKETAIGDNDRLLTLMTRDMGVIRAFAVGAKSVKSRRGSATGLLAYSNFNIDKTGDTYKIVEASANKVFFGAGSDVVTLAVAQYFCELCAFFGPHDETAEEFLRVILNSLYYITEKKRDPVLIKAITELRICALSGYSPSLIACADCGQFEDKTMYFSFDNGSIYCENCKKPNCTALNLTVLKAMRHIIYSKLENLYGFEIPDKDIKTLEKITERYLVFQSEHRFATLEFYHSVI
ncbi:MAG: DNA repair protein RecO [Clostridia bacterium]|nr:DNA repair protein RecO [Clostridia bacterium]